MITPSSFFRHCFSNCPLLEILVLLTYCMHIYALSTKRGRSFCPHLRMHILNHIFKVVCAKLPAWGTAVNEIQDLVGLRREGGGKETSSLRWKYKLFKRWDWKGKHEPGLRSSVYLPAEGFRICLKAKREISKLSPNQGSNPVTFAF